MNVSIEEVSSVEKKISVTIPANKVQRELDRAYRNLQRDVRMRGFRQGKVPRKILEARFGRQITSEVSSRLIEDTLGQTIDDEKLFVVSRPAIEPGPLAKGDDFSYTATVEVKPVVEATGYRGLALEKDNYATSDEVLNNKIEQMRRESGSIDPIEEERAVEEGDVLLINYTLSIDGEVLEGPIDNFQVEVRRDALLPGFADHVIGMKIGEEKTFEVESPEESPQPQLAGKTLSFQVTVNEIKVLVLPELDDEFAKDKEFDSLDAMKEAFQGEQRAHLDLNATEKLGKDIVAKLIEANEFTLPSGLIGQQTDRLVHSKTQELKGQGLGDMAATIADASREVFKAQAELNLRKFILLESVAKQENIEVSDEDVNAHFATMAKAQGQRAEALKGQYAKAGALDTVKDEILMNKTLVAIEGMGEITLLEKTYDDHNHDGDDHDHGDHAPAEHDHAEHEHGPDCDHD